MKISYLEYTLLTGENKKLVQKVGDGSIITRFDKTPLPIDLKDVVCPHFMELKWAYGCPFDCAWCYLKGTFRFQATGTKPILKPLKKTIEHLETFFKSDVSSEILNSGEISDSLMFENGGSPFSKTIIPLFENQSKHKILFVTKSKNIKNLLAMESHKQVIISFSINSYAVAKKWEKSAPSISDRLEAAKELHDLGYEVRIRIDPMVPILDWKKHYKSLIEDIFSKLIPDRLTLGSLRGLQSTINGVKDRTWVKYLNEGSSWGKKIEFNTRYLMYKNIIDFLEDKYNYKQISLCKETVEMWNKLGLIYKSIKCNCVW